MMSILNRYKVGPIIKVFTLAIGLGACVQTSQSTGTGSSSISDKLRASRTITSAMAFNEALGLCYAGRADFSDLPAILKSKGFQLKAAKGEVARFVNMIGKGKRFGQPWTVALDVSFLILCQVSRSMEKPTRSIRLNAKLICQILRGICEQYLMRHLHTQI